MTMITFLPTFIPSRWRSLLGNLLIVASLVILAAFTAYQSRLHYQRLAEVSLTNLCQAMGKHIGSVVEKTDISLRTVALEAEREIAAGSINPALLNDVLVQQKALQPDLYSLRATDIDGTIRYGMGGLPANNINVADRDYFIQLRDNPSAGLVISQPYMGRVSKQWTMMIARRLNRPDGSFAGVVFAVITIDHLKEMLAPLDLGSKGIVALHTEDLRLVARIPDDAQAIGTRVSTKAFEESLAVNRNSGLFKAISPLDNLERSFAYRKVTGAPFYILVGRATEDFLAAWWEEVLKLAGIVTAFGMLTLWLLRDAQQAAEQQQEARQLLHEAVDSIDAGFSVFDRDDRLVICNDAYRSFHPASRQLLTTGVKFENIVRHKASSGHYPESIASPEEWVQHHLQHHRLGDGIPFEQRTDDGRHILTVEHRTESGYTVSNQMDITELAQYREHLEQLVVARTAELKEALNQFRILVEQAPTAIAMLDKNMTYLAASARWVQTYGAGQLTLVGRNHYEAHPDLPDEWKTVHQSALSGFPQESDEDCWIRADGSKLWVNWAVYPWRDEHGDIGGIIISGDDITKRKQAEEEILRLNADLERRVKKRTEELSRANEALLHSNMELKNFAHAAAHDLQTPLRSIAGFAQLMQREVQGQGNERLNEFSALVIENTKRLQTLIQELLNYTRLDAQGLPFEPVDLRDVLDEVVSSLTILIQETGTEVHCKHLPTLPADRIQIAQVLQNLIENGIKYNQSKPPRVSIACELQEDEWLFSVTDNGIGIEPKYHERIFDIFSRLHAYHQVPGTGIGLALCRRIVERHGGRIWVESILNKGSTFYFSLPLQRGQFL